MYPPPLAVTVHVSAEVGLLVRTARDGAVGWTHAAAFVVTHMLGLAAPQ
jgi:hypothetical protein